MKEKIFDFHVRLWGDTVFIHDITGVNYMCMGDEIEGFQCEHEEGTKEYDDLRRVCAEIAEKFREFGKLLN